MLYRSFQDIQISALGFGAMRLPVIDGNDAKIDVEGAKKMVDEAFRAGINYFDTAWGYHNGNSELVMGEALASHPRESFYLADKFPGYDLGNMTKVREIFPEQLRKTGVEYFDFYLFHNVCEMNIDYYLDPKYGIYDYLMQMKSEGKIKHLGFSCHGELDVLKRFLDAYGKDMEFCQLQLNYLDWMFQHGKEKVEMLREWDIPVWVMEPLRGGKLAKMPERFSEKLLAMRPDEEIPAWGFRFLMSIPEVTVILSGMSNMEQLQSNVKTFSEDKALDASEMEGLMTVADEMLSVRSAPCTACQYCVSHCPMELDIPRLIALFNEHNFTIDGGGFDFIAPMAVSALPAEKKPSACLHCQSCEAVCPQNIGISGIMEEFAGIVG